jgi:hypothetical protein
MALIAGLAVLVIKAVQHYRRQVDEAWEDAAKRLGLRFTRGSFGNSRSIGGHLHDNRVRVDTYTRSTGKSSTTFTRYRVDFPESLGLGLSLKQQGFMAGVATFFGSQDIELGDPRFDPQVVVKGSDPWRVAQFLTPARRLRILRLFENYSGCEITDRTIEWSKRSVDRDPARIVTHVKRLALAATRICASSEAEKELDQALEARREGRLDEATAAFERESRKNPEDEELGALALETREVGESMPTPAAPPQAPPIVPPPMPPLDSAAVCEDLFGFDLRSSDAKRRFDERYKDRTVRWSGKLRRVSGYQLDMVFKGDPGTKMVLEIHEVAGGAFGRKAQAIVQLPKESLESLRLRVGERITFEGRLASCDVLMCNLYVADASLV